MVSITAPSRGPNIAKASRIIPRPDIPVQPVLSLQALLGSRRSTVASVLDAGDVVDVSAGRVAIALALEKLGIGKGDKVLIPAYHCITMVEPLSWVSAIPVFYRVREDLSVDMEDVARKCDDSTKVLMVAHYFGFPQPIRDLRRFCDDKNLMLLEDCAHSFFGQVDGKPLGSFGDYAIASPTKFFPIPDGGCLISSKADPAPVDVQRQGVMADIRSAFAILSTATEYGRLWPARPLVLAMQMIWAPLRLLASRGYQETPDIMGNIGEVAAHSGAAGGFDPAWMNRKMSSPSRFVYRRASTRRIAARRRRNFQVLVEAFDNTPGCRPLIKDVPDGCVPYLFPLWIDELDRLFPILEDAAIPMQRFGQFLWPSVDESICPISASLSKHVLQLPCHQDLSDREIVAITNRVRSVMSANG